MERPKYYISIKLNRKIKFGVWVWYNAIILFIMAIVIIPSAYANQWLLIPLLAYAVGALELDGRTVFSKDLKIMSHILSDKNYSLKEALESENNRANKI